MSRFYIVERQAGAENPAIPTWANNSVNPANLTIKSSSQLKRIEVENVPGAFQILNVLTPEECQRLITISEDLGYLKDAAVSLPRSVRHNDSFTWVTDELTNEIIWKTCHPFIHDGGREAVGLNARFRFYRYKDGDYFAPHTDGSWTGSKVVNGSLLGDAYGDRYSRLTFLLFLTEDFKGGATQFYVDKDNPQSPARILANAHTVGIRTPIGGVLCFPHGQHPLHCIHSSEKILSGEKYIIRSDVLFTY